MAHRRLALTTTIFALALASAAVADSPAAPAPADQRAKAGTGHLDDQAVICKRVEQTGSRLGASSTCLTRGQWAEIARSSRDNVAKVQGLSREFAPPSH